MEDAIEKEIPSPGKLLGHRAMHKKIQEVHGLNVPRDLVHNVMTKLDPNGLKERGGVGKVKCKDKALVSGVSTTALQIA